MLRLLLAVAPLVFGLGPEVAEAKPAKHRPKKPRTTESASWATSPAAKYGALSKAQCLAELRRRGIGFSEVRDARGVLVPVRLKGAVSGVLFKTEAPEAARAKSPHEVFDCRLVLSLSDFAAILKKHDVEEATLFSAWRPPPKSWPADKPATRHPGALAVDIRRLVVAPDAEGKRNELVVERDWTPKRDTPPCSGTVSPDTAAAKTLRAIFCEADEKRLFTVMLSPNYDKAHENHFHLEVTPGVKWRLVL
jgi:hypothetical protein